MNWIEQHDAFDQKDLLESILHDLGEAVRLERIATNKGFRHCKNLETALRSLGLVLLMLGRKQECMSTVAEQHYWLSRQMPFALEDKGKAAIIPNFDWIHGVASNGEKRRVLLKTNDLDRPILQPNEIEVILEAVDRQRQLSSEETSRFTMQYSGNADFHLSDLCQVDPEVQDIVDSMLQTKLYPLVRRAFGSTVPSAPLCVYDALVVRYDSDEAIRNGKEGASLPLVSWQGIERVFSSIFSLIVYFSIATVECLPSIFSLIKSLRAEEHFSMACLRIVRAIHPSSIPWLQGKPWRIWRTSVTLELQ